MSEPTPENAAAETPLGSEAVGDTAAAATAGEPAAVVAAVEGLAAAVLPEASTGMGGLPSASGPDIDLSHLPLHTRSLLKIRVAVRVTLARQRRPIQEIMELGPGTLVKFEKTYDEPLELSVGDLPIAQGEAVKVGDKFGLRIGKIIRPHERFKSVG